MFFECISTCFLVNSPLFPMHSIEWENACERWFGKVLERSGCGTFLDNIPKFRLQGLRKTIKSSDKPVSSPIIVPGISRIRKTATFC